MPTCRSPAAKGLCPAGYSSDDGCGVQETVKLNQCQGVWVEGLRASGAWDNSFDCVACQVRWMGVGWGGVDFVRGCGVVGLRRAGWHGESLMQAACSPRGVMAVQKLRKRGHVPVPVLSLRPSKPVPAVRPHHEQSFLSLGVGLVPEGGQR